MYEFLHGEIVELTPTYLVLLNQGIGYFIHITLNTYSQLSDKKHCEIFLHQVIKEDAHQFYGFSEKSERGIFRHLISVSGIGANTARMILSSLTPDEVRDAIASSNVALLQKIKGIGTKTAQRVIVDLKDKVGKTASGDEKLLFKDNTIREESLSALVMLGFSKSVSEKVIDNILVSDRDITVETLVKKALQMM